MTDKTRTLLSVARREASAAMMACLRAGESMAAAVVAGGAVYMAEIAHATPERPVVIDARISQLDAILDAHNDRVGRCVVCDGGALGSLDKCINCLSDELDAEREEEMAGWFI